MNAARPVVITGGRGLVGRALAGVLRAAGRPVRVLTRGEPRAPDERRWDPHAPEPALFEGAHSIVHLAGETLSVRWTEARRHAIRRSRVDVTRALVRALASIPVPPRALISASAVGIYGDRGDELLDERSAVGRGFLADVAREWEGAALSAEPLGIRVVRPRFGLVLDPSGGALAPLLPIFRSGLGGPIGNGDHWWSWISIDDLCAILVLAIDDDSWSGAVNAVSPAPVTQREFSRALGRAVGRPSWLPVPRFALRLRFGRMADEMLLASQRVLPRRLDERGFHFRHGALDQALVDLIRPSHEVR
ncbi:MAG TPA: TIGR01777 family oxidoreductase [Candidatus Udaeobacter sp.]|jgi:uncharacterized protein (TIGR01777 family)|nr:TIGR01777 family oxidoreductase [Candidatus Udaeobacter sp.]